MALILGVIGPLCSVVAFYIAYRMVSHLFYLGGVYCVFLTRNWHPSCAPSTSYILSYIQGNSSDWQDPGRSSLFDGITSSRNRDHQVLFLLTAIPEEGPLKTLKRKKSFQEAALPERIRAEFLQKCSIVALDTTILAHSFERSRSGSFVSLRGDASPQYAELYGNYTAYNGNQRCGTILRHSQEILRGLNA